VSSFFGSKIRFLFCYTRLVMGKSLNLIGIKYGRLVVRKRVGSRNGKSLWEYFGLKKVT